MLTNSDIAELTDWRRDLHRFPEVSGEEEGTAARVVASSGPAKTWRARHQMPCLRFASASAAIPCRSAGLRPWPGDA